VRQTEEEKKFTEIAFQEVKKMLVYCFKKKDLEIEVDMFGSTTNDLALRGSSDLDVCIKIINS
jgi:DNA polymerase sigma